MSRDILIVDTLCSSRILACGEVSAGHHAVRSCATEEEAWAALDAACPDLLVLGAGDGQPGADFLRRLRARPGTRRLPVLAIAAEEDRAARLRLLHAGADEVLTRPYDPALLLGRIRTLLRGADELADLAQGGAGGLAPDMPGLAEPEEGFGARATIRVVTGRAGRMPEAIEPLSRRHALSLDRETLSSGRAGAPAPDLVILDAAGGAPDLAAAIRLAGDGRALHSAALFRQIAEIRSHGPARHAAILALVPPQATNLAVMALDLGAQNVVTPDIGAEELAWRAEGLIRRKRDQDRCREELRVGLKAALHDPMTGLYNRRYALPALDRQAQAPGPPGQLAVMMIDVDDFKAINDRFGHAAGDSVIVAIAQRLEGLVPPEGMVARLGGEEFLAVLPVAGRDAAVDAAERMRRHVAERPVTVDGPGGGCAIRLAAAVSIGLALGTGGEAGSDILARADRALMAAKRAGKNRVIGPASIDGADLATLRPSTGGIHGLAPPGPVLRFGKAV